MTRDPANEALMLRASKHARRQVGDERSAPQALPDLGTPLLMFWIALFGVALAALIVALTVAF